MDHTIKRAYCCAHSVLKALRGSSGSRSDRQLEAAQSRKAEMGRACAQLKSYNGVYINSGEDGQRHICPSMTYPLHQC